MGGRREVFCTVMPPWVWHARRKAMSYERSYHSYEEFEREELSRDRRLDQSYEDLLSDFVDDKWKGKKRAQEGLFDAYEGDE